MPAPAAREVVDQLAAIVGPEQVSVAPIDRLTYARDMYTVAIIKHAEGKLEHFPHVIVWPANEDELIRVVKLAPDLGLPVIPFGAGSGVCGGTLPIHGGIMLDVKRLGRIVEINDDDLTVTAQAGINGQVLEMELNRHGYTLGHFPSSIHCSTLGGWVAARSAGQLSSKYGKIEDMLIALRWVCPDGRVYSSPIVPGRSTGPDFDQILTGSEGTLGVCTEATLRICPYPADRRFVAFTFPDVPTATEAMRMMLRNDLRPAAMRLYDALDTMLVGTSGSTEHTQGKSLGDLLQIEQIGNRVRTLAPDLFRKAQRFVAGNAQIANQLELLAKEGCMLILMFEGERELTDYEF
ncbi:FAD-binding oxidoreductase, partial [bacterium]|nr:FAD-binding oxidoreductase [bacterium]